MGFAVLAIASASLVQVSTTVVQPFTIAKALYWFVDAIATTKVFATVIIAEDAAAIAMVSATTVVAIIKLVVKQAQMVTKDQMHVACLVRQHFFGQFVVLVVLGGDHHHQPQSLIFARCGCYELGLERGLVAS